MRRTKTVHRTIQGPEDPVVVHLAQDLEVVRPEVPQNQTLEVHLTARNQDLDLGEVLKEANPQGGGQDPPPPSYGAPPPSKNSKVRNYSTVS